MHEAAHRIEMLFALGMVHLRLDAAEIEVSDKLDPTILHEPFFVSRLDRTQGAAAPEFIHAPFRCRDDCALLARKAWPVAFANVSGIGREDAIDIAFQHCWKAAPPQRRNERND